MLLFLFSPCCSSYIVLFALFIESSYVTFCKYSADAIIFIFNCFSTVFLYIAAALSEGCQNKISFTLMYLYTRCNK